MTKPVNIAEAKADLSALVDRAVAGEEIILSKAGRPATYDRRMTAGARGMAIPSSRFSERGLCAGDLLARCVIHRAAEIRSPRQIIRAHRSATYSV